MTFFSDMLPFKTLLWLKRVRVFPSLLGVRLDLWVAESSTSLAPAELMKALALELKSSRDPRYSAFILVLIKTFPDEVIESSDELRLLFARDGFGAKSVRAGIEICQQALRSCFRVSY